MKPDYLQVYPTLRCNQDCPFCFNRGVDCRDEMRPEDFDRLAAVAAQWGIGSIDLLGGEPTLHTGLFSIIGSLHARNIHTTLSSNGTDLDQLNALYRAYGRSTLRIGVSINSARVPEELHRFLLDSRPMVKSLFKKGGRIPPACEPYAGNSGIDYFLIYRDAVETEDLAESVGFCEFFSAIGRLKTIWPRLKGVFCSGFLPDTRTRPDLATVRCPAGTTKLSVLPDGSVYPCYLFFRYPEFELGNILEEDFQAIWKNPKLDFFRKFEENRCPKTDCALHDRCHGGCPAMSFRFYGDPAGPDPRCVPPDRLTQFLRSR